MLSQRLFLLTAILLSPILSSAQDYICTGSVETSSFFRVTDLSFDGGIYAGHLSLTEDKAIQYTVEKNAGSYQFKAQLEGEDALLLNEKDISFPAKREKEIVLPENNLHFKITIECEPFDFIKYCRLHTC